MRIGRVVILFTFLLFCNGLMTNVLAQSDARQFVYRFENARFDTTFVELKLQGNGEGLLRYKRRDEDSEIELPMKLLPATVQRLKGFFDTLKFLDTQDSYQGNAQLAHMGKITLVLNESGRNREVSFNYTDNKTVQKLVELFRAIENQERRANEIKLSRQFSPLDLPRQLKFLEDELKRERLAEPVQLLGLLSEIAQDDSLPLIARNAAERLSGQIKRGK